MLFRVPFPAATRPGTGGPDVTFISFERCPVPLGADGRGAEWSSRRPLPDEAEGLLAKAHGYLEGRARLVWLVYPRLRVLHAYQSPTSSPRVHRGRRPRRRPGPTRVPRADGPAPPAHDPRARTGVGRTRTHPPVDATPASTPFPGRALSPLRGTGPPCPARSRRPARPEAWRLGPRCHHRRRRARPLIAEHVGAAGRSLGWTRIPDHGLELAPAAARRPAGHAGPRELRSVAPAAWQRWAEGDRRGALADLGFAPTSWTRPSAA